MACVCRCLVDALLTPEVQDTLLISLPMVDLETNSTLKKFGGIVQHKISMQISLYFDVRNKVSFSRIDC
jgi:hypothetical protein